MSQLDDLLKIIPIDQIAAQLGVSDTEAREAVTEAVPALLGGMAVNSESEAGAQSLTTALGKHADSDPSAVFGKATDGDKIVNKVFGDKSGEVADVLAAKGGENVTADLIAKVLPIVAPIVLSFLASKFLGGGSSSNSASSDSAGGGIGDLLGGLLGGGSGSGSSSGGLGDLLGGLGGLFGGR